MLFPRRPSRPKTAGRSAVHCRDCGGFIEAGSPVKTYRTTQTELRLDPRGPDSGNSGIIDGTRTWTFGQCASCRAVSDRAAALVAEHRAFAARLGNDAAVVPLFESALLALDLLGVPRQVIDAALTGPGAKKAVGLLARRDVGLTEAGSDARYLGWVYPTYTLRGQRFPNNGTPWSHLGAPEGERAKAAYHQWQKLRVERPEPIPAPEGGCGFCGVATVAELPSRALAAWDAARRVSSGNVGGRSRPDLITIHLCPECRESVEATQGVLGDASLSRALLDFLGHPRYAYFDQEVDGIFAWCVTERAAERRGNATRWEHLGPALDEFRRSIRGSRSGLTKIVRLTDADSVAPVMPVG